jgi:lipid II:glycine glycyltransferase (peptidoglycan interpeptide bridge formation enzyme)
MSDTKRRQQFITESYYNEMINYFDGSAEFWMNQLPEGDTLLEKKEYRRS